MNTKPNAQTKLIEKHLKKGKSITPIEALNLFGCFRLAARFYRRSAVDKVIEYLQNQLSLARTSLLKSLATAQHEARNSKYKRCLAMAMLCNEKWLVHNFAEIPVKLRLYNKWEKRWLELAEKFKEAK